MIVSLRDSTHYLARILDENDCPACSVSIMGKPLVVHNISKIFVPAEFHAVSDIIQENFPSIGIREYAIGGPDHDQQAMQLGMNAVVTETSIGDLIINEMVYPWDILAAMDLVLQSEIKDSIISENASISETSVIKGPCIVDDGVFVDDFSKIKGPVYLGKNSSLSLIHI